MEDNKMKDFEINEEDLVNVAGGLNNNTIILRCPVCNCDREFKIFSGARAYCKKCNAELMV